MKRSSVLRRLVGFVVGAAFLLSLASPARAQFDPMTLSLILGGFQLLTGAISMISIGIAADAKNGIAMPYGTPCGMVDGVPQICWQPHAGGFEGSPDLPTRGKSGPAPPVQQVDSGTPSLSLGLSPTLAPTVAPSDVLGQ
jgi:hypothetical protein